MPIDLSQQPLTLSVNIEIRQNYGAGLHIHEEAELPPAAFMECAKVLGQFHDLIESIKKSRCA